MVLDVFTQWSTAEPMVNKGSPAWVSEEDRLRIASYSLYEQIYSNIPEAYSLAIRGDDDAPIYIPAAKVIVETLNRYMANNLNIIADPELGDDTQRANAMVLLNTLLRRERFASRFTSAKRFGIIRGDWLFHIYADANKPAGSRISIFPVDPASYFPIYNEENIDEIVGVHIAEQITLPGDDKTYISRLTYRKTAEEGGPSPISVEEAIYEADDWGGPGMGDGTPKQVVRAPETLDPEITQIPIYHIQNFQRPGSLWGTSEISGYERILTGINQSISDEDLALALEALGVYVTDGGAPVDKESGEPVAWNIGPGRVIELADGKRFDRVSGISSVTPYQDHLKYLHQRLDLASGTPSIAQGRVDVGVAESGIALMLELAPILSRAEEKELVITDVLTNMLYDLKAWFRAYEQTDIGEAVWIPTYGDKIPVNRTKRFEELMTLFQSGLVSASWTRSELGKIGFTFPDDATLLNAILEERQAVAQVEMDLYGARADAELGAEPNPADASGAGVPGAGAEV